MPDYNRKERPRSRATEAGRSIMNPPSHPLWRHRQFSWLAMFCLGIIPARAETPTRARDVVTDQELRSRLEAAPSMEDYLKQGAVARADIAVKRPRLQHDLISRSIVVHDGRFFTLLPPGCVLHLPPSLRERILSKPEGDFLTWSAFLKRNAAWLKSQEVSLENAKGDVRGIEQLARNLAGESKAVIAVYKNGPISLLQPEPPDAEKP